MTRTGWEHYDLEKEMSTCNMAGLLELFKRESDKFRNKCIEYVTSSGKLTEEGKKQLEQECDLLSEGREKLAITIAEMLTDAKRYQHEIRPER